MKFSRQRELIISEVLNSDEHLTADAIYERLKKENPNLSLGTVYRNLTQLSDKAWLARLVYLAILLDLMVIYLIIATLYASLVGKLLI